MDESSSSDSADSLFEQSRKNYELHFIMNNVSLSEDKRREKITALLKAGANINVKHDFRRGNTPLHIAVERGNPEEIAFLLAQGADPQSKNQHGEIPLMLALKRKAAGKLQNSTVVALLTEVLPAQAKADSALFAAMLEPGIMQEERIQRLQQALDQGANINVPDSSDQNNTVLHQAVLQGEIEVVQFLLEQGANPRAKNQGNTDPVQLCISNALEQDMRGEAMDGALVWRFSAFDGTLTRKLAEIINNKGNAFLDKKFTIQDLVNFSDAFSKQLNEPNCQQAAAIITTYITARGIDSFNFTPKNLTTLLNAFSKQVNKPACQQAVTNVTTCLQALPTSTRQAFHVATLVQCMAAEVGSSPRVETVSASACRAELPCCESKILTDCSSEFCGSADQHRSAWGDSDS